MNITTSITLNMQTPSYAVAYEPQGNKLSRFITATLKDGDASWSVPNGASALIRVAKPDNTFAVYDRNEKGQTAYTISGSTITIELVGAALSAAGDALVTIMFIDSTGSNLSPFSFRLIVTPSAVSDDDIESSDYFNAFQETINQLMAMYGSPLTAATAAGMTDTTKVYVYVGSESGYVNGNWYYYNGSAWVSGGVYNSEGINTNWTYASFVVEQAIGSPAHFTDGADGIPIKSLTIPVDLIQSGSGDPSPDNVRAITGFTEFPIRRYGKNFVYTGNGSTGTNVVFTKNASEGSVVVSGTATGSIATHNLNYGPSFQGYPTGVMLIVSGGVGSEPNESNAVAVRVCYTKAGSSTTLTAATSTGGNRVAFTLPSDTTASWARLVVEGTYSGTRTVYPMVAFANDPTDFEPWYNATTYTVSWENTAGTVYGGTLTYNGNGIWTLTKTKQGFNGGNFTWSKVSNSEYCNFYLNVTRALYDANISTVISTNYKGAASNAGATAQADNYVWIRNNSGTSQLCVKDTSKEDMTAAQFKEAMSGVLFVYDLKPEEYEEYTITTDIVLSKLGVNTFTVRYNNSFYGNLDISYRADTALYIQKLTGSTEDDMIANENIESGKYFMVGNTLYLSTSAIAVGETIVPNTNCTQTNLASALNALNAN